MSNHRTALVSPLFTGTDQDDITRARRVFKGGSSPSVSPTRQGAPHTDAHRISVPEITAILTNLRSYSDVAIGDLPKNIRDDLDNFSEMASLVSQTNFYTELVKIMNKIFGNVTVIRADTVGAFFQGCFRSSNFPGLQSCSATCAGMMPPPQDLTGWSLCTENVIFFDGETLKHQHESLVKTDKAIIHVTNPTKYTGFTPTHIKQLEESGFKTVSLFFVDGDDKYTEKLNSQPINSLPIRAPRMTTSPVSSGSPVSPISSVSPSGSRPSPPHHDDNEGGNGWVWLLIILGVILFICLLVWWSKKSRSTWGYVAPAAVAYPAAVATGYPAQQGYPAAMTQGYPATMGYKM
jgi:hypothetical protein